MTPERLYAPGSYPDPTLTTNHVYNNVRDIQNEIVNARVWIGFHFRNSVVQGENLGNDVAAYDLAQAFQPAQ